MRALGELEAAVMDTVWASDRPVSVRVVFERLAREKDLAYTTVMTVMERLWRKRILTRKREGKAFLYEARRTRPEFAAALMKDLLRWARDPEGVLVRFVDDLRPSEAEELRRLIAGRRPRRGR